jgi:hypothetical protein
VGLPARPLDKITPPRCVHDLRTVILAPGVEAVGVVHYGRYPSLRVSLASWEQPKGRPLIGRYLEGTEA